MHPLGKKDCEIRGIIHQYCSISQRLLMCRCAVVPGVVEKRKKKKNLKISICMTDLVGSKSGLQAYYYMWLSQAIKD